MKKTIVFFSHTSEMSGGAEMSMLEFADKMKDTYNVVFIVRKPHRGLQKEIRDNGYRYESVYFTQWAQIDMPDDLQVLEYRRKKNNRAITEIENILRKHKADVVITNTSVAPWAAIAASRAGVAHIWHIREYCDPAYRYGFLIDRKKLYKDMHMLSDVLITNSDRLQQYVDSMTGESTSRVIHNVMNIQEFTQLADADEFVSPFTEDSLKLIIVGRIKKSKGQVLVVRALKELHNKGYSVELCLVGTPSTRQEEGVLQGAIEELGLAESVHIAGFQANPAPFIEAADIGMVISDNEAFGRTTIEYLALNKPVIGHKSGATQDIIEHNKNGLLVDDFEVSSIAEAIEMYIKNPAVLRRHSAAAESSLEALFTESKSYTELLRILKSIRSTKKDHTETAIYGYQQRPITYDRTPKRMLIAVRFMLRDAYLRLF